MGLLKKNVSMPVWGLIVGFIVAVGIGGAGAAGDDMTAELTAAEARAEQAEAEASEAEDALEEAEARADDAEAAARAELEDEYAQREQELADRTAELDARETEISQAEEVASMSEFGNGVWHVGVDIVPGRYRAEGGSSCYWQKSPVDASDDIIDNGLVDGPTTVVIQDDILFTSQDCGTWTKVN